MMYILYLLYITHIHLFTCNMYGIKWRQIKRVKSLSGLISLQRQFRDAEEIGGRTSTAERKTETSFPALELGGRTPTAAEIRLTSYDPVRTRPKPNGRQFSVRAPSKPSFYPFQPNSQNQSTTTTQKSVPIFTLFLALLRGVVFYCWKKGKGRLGASPALTAMAHSERRAPTERVDERPQAKTVRHSHKHCQQVAWLGLT